MYNKFNLKNRRTELDLTQKAIAEYVGVSEATVSRWESGDIADMGASRITALAKVLRISPLDIMGWDEDIKKDLAADKGNKDQNEDKSILISMINQMTDAQAKNFREIFELFQANLEKEK